LRVGLNLTYLVDDSGGSGTYARALIPELLAAEPGLELTVWHSTTAPRWLEREPWAGEVRRVQLPVPGIGSPWHLLYELGSLGIDARRRRIELVHGLANLAPLVHPGVATVATIHDVIWINHPEATDPRFRLVMRTLVPLVARTASRLITISEAARGEISRALGVDSGRFDITPLGVSTPDARFAVARSAGQLDLVRRELGLREGPLVLCVAAKRAHKNLDGLIRALALLPEPRPQLVLPGSPTPYEQQLRQLAAELGVAKDVLFPGWLEQDRLEALYALASCFVLPSFEEGFGLPILEAMVRGVPVACSNCSSLPEVAGDAALYFDPHDPGSIASAIERLLGDRELAGRLAEQGTERCKEFTWRRTAEATLACYRRALDRLDRRSTPRRARRGAPDLTLRSV